MEKFQLHSLEIFVNLKQLGEMPFTNIQEVNIENKHLTAWWNSRVYIGSVIVMFFPKSCLNCMQMDYQKNTGGDFSMSDNFQQKVGFLLITTIFAATMAKWQLYCFDSTQQSNESDLLWSMRTQLNWKKQRKSMFCRWKCHGKHLSTTWFFLYLTTFKMIRMGIVCFF